MRLGTRSFMGFPVFVCPILVSVSLEIPELVLVSVLLCRRAKTPPGYLSFFFRLGYGIGLFAQAIVCPYR